MKIHTSAFKNQIKEYGREIDSIITYRIDEELIELGNEELNSITSSYEGSLLKSVMRQLVIDSNVDIPVGIELHLRFGIKVRDDETVEDYSDNYDYVNFGNYIVKEVTKKEDTNSYEIKCYDKMLYSMIEYDEYQQLDITYPITIRNYINVIASKLGLVFKNINDTFPNYDKEINEELFLSKNVEVIEPEEQTDEDEEEEETTEENNEEEVNENEEENEEEVVQEEPEEKITYTSLGYTYRDILDQLAQVTASTICINELDDELELRYINETNDVIDEEYLKDSNVNFSEKYGPINSIILSRSAESDNVFLQDEESVDENGLCELKIVDNQIMNFDDRSEYLEDILDELDGLEYYINDFSSTGIVYYNLCDKYSVVRDNTTYECIMFNDEISITQGLEENIHTDLPEDSETDYSKADKTDIRINKATLIVDKQNNTINSLVQTVQTQGDGLNSLTNRVEQNITSTETSINTIEQKLENGVESVRNSLVTIDINGINVSTEQSDIKTLMTNEQFKITSGDTVLAYFGYDNEIGSTKAEMDNLTVTNYFVTGYHRFEKFDIDGENRTGVFYIGE